MERSLPLRTRQVPATARCAASGRPSFDDEGARQLPLIESQSALFDFTFRDRSIDAARPE